MGVYIEGMEMPRTGQIYTFEIVKHDEVPYIRIRAGLDVVDGVCGINLEEKWEEYPLVEVPVPHGRLVDVDALQNKGADVCCRDYYDSDVWGFSYDMIDDAPTVIETEREDDDY